ncbi:MAG: hypothetical protein ACNA8W_14100 [Bradymonadaceae bacterium]
MNLLRNNTPDRSSPRWSWKGALVIWIVGSALALSCHPSSDRSCTIDEDCAAGGICFTDADESRSCAYAERFPEVMYSAGLSSLAGQCDGVDGTATLRYTMLDTDGRPMAEKDGLFGRILPFQDRRIFSLPDQLCESATDCPSGFVCTTASAAMGDQFKRCNVQTELSVQGAPRFVANTTSHRLFGVLFENAGSLRGWLPPDVARLRPVDEEGVVTGEADTLAIYAPRASDHSKMRSTLLSGLEMNWERTASFARNNGDRTTNFGFWTFAGSRAGVVSRIAANSPTNEVWTSQMSDVLQATTDYREVAPDQTRANVYEAINTVLTEGYEDAEFNGWDKHLVVFVDGPDDLRLEQNHTVDTVIARARAAGVRLYILHLDARLDTDTLRDDYRYYENQSPCADDSACSNFEECRLPERYSDSVTGGVTYPVDHAENPEARYCLPARDANGRIGPIEDYSRIACETQGGYIYVPSAHALRSRGDWLPYALDGLWEIDLVVGAADLGNLPPGQPFKLQTQMTMQFGAHQLAYNFHQHGQPNHSFIDDDDAADTRAVFFTAP